MIDSIKMLISDDLVQSVFKQIANNRSVQFKDLKSELQSSGTDVKSEAIENAVTVLKDADLIKESTAPIKDFNTYYVTADGLSVGRKLDLAQTGRL